MRMIDLAAGTGSSQRGINNNKNRRIIVVDTTTSVDCSSSTSSVVREQVTRSSSFRSLLGCMLPYCCGFPPNFFQSSSDSSESLSVSSDTTTDSTTTSTTTTTSSTTVVTGTFFGYRKGRVSFCLQDHSRSSSPLLLLEFAVQTAYLAKEMQHGQLRIALEECHDGDDDIRSSKSSSSSSSSNSKQQQYSSLYNVPAWSMYCNGRKVGYAMRRQMSVSDLAVLKLMQSVSVGAGILPNNTSSNTYKTCKLCDDQNQPKNHHHHHHHHQNHQMVVDDAAAAGDLMYLRATFQRVIGSLHSHSFHMINPAGTSAQDLSIFLLRSSS